MEELKQYMDNSFNERKVGILTHIESYLNRKYPNVRVTYKNNGFIIEGDELEAEKCRKEIEEVLNISAKNENK